MSNRILAPRGPTLKHTLQDDLESLLYVVLYCALLYLPHNLSKEKLSQTIRLLFEDARFINGRLAGGQGKLDNANSRMYTEPVKFNTPLKDWLDTIMDYCDPPSGLQMQREDPWTQLHLLDKFWADFLQTHTLEANDREEHDHPHVTDEYEEDAEQGRPMSSEAISLGKRPSEERVVHRAPVSKKSRVVAATSTPAQPLRRSKRNRDQQEQSSQPLRITRSVTRELAKRTAVRTQPLRRGTSRRK